MEAATSRLSKSLRTSGCTTAELATNEDVPRNTDVRPRVAPPPDAANAYTGTSSKSAGQTQKIARASAKSKATTATRQLDSPAPPSPNHFAAARPASATDCPDQGASAGDIALVRACRANNVPQGQARALLNFVRDNGVDSAGVAEAMKNAKQNPQEAGKAYAVLSSAARTVSSAHARRMQKAAQAIREGKVAMVLRDEPMASASYDRDHNVMRLPAEGIALEDLGSRTLLVHEATHLAQDAEHAFQSRLDAERQGYDTAADYYLHAIGAIRDTADGPALDFNVPRPALKNDTTFDVQARDTAMLGRARENAHANKHRLNRGMERSSEEELERMTPVDDFEEHYLRIQKAMGATDAELEAMRTPQQKDGL